MAPSDPLHFITILPAGRDYGANTWRLPDSPLARADRIAANFDTARISEAAKLDAVLYADIAFGVTPQFWEPRPPEDLEALTLLSAIAAVTDKIGLVPSLSTTFDIPWHVARRVLSLDHLSGGRAGWNIVATFSEPLARAISAAGLPPHFERYRRADEFTRIVTSLWDGFDGRAGEPDPTRRIFTPRDGIHPTTFQGEFFDVHGLLGATRSVQGRPVLFQAGSSPDGVDFAARHAEAVFTSQKDLDGAVEFATQLRSRAGVLGRRAPLTLPGLTFVIGSTEAEARRLEQQYIDAVVPSVWLDGYAATYFRPEDAARLADDLDAPLPPFVESVEGYQTAFTVARNQVRDKTMTVRDFLTLTVRGDQFAYWVGTPEQIAEKIIAWHGAGAADGFILVLFHQLNHQLQTFADEVLPILRRRGLFRQDYEGSTLREHLGLDLPAHAAAS